MGKKSLFRVVGLRRVSQAFFLGLFLLLFFMTNLPVMTSQVLDEVYTISAPVALFFHLDPLLAVSHLLASWSPLWAFLWAVPVVILAFVFNRVFCGWVCPFGTIHHLFSLGKRSLNTKLRNQKWRWRASRNTKYAVLFLVLAASVFGVNWVGWLDPLSFLTRSLTVVIHPMLGVVIDGLVSLLDKASLSGVSDFLLNLLRGKVIPFQSRYFIHAFTIGALFFLVLGLNRFETRFWCRYICPLGALMGLFARQAPLVLVKNEDRCTGCRLCLKHCQGGDQPILGENWIPSECHFCYNCVDVCPDDALAFQFTAKPSKADTRDVLPDLQRRVVLGGILGGFFLAPLQSIGAENLEKGEIAFKLSDRLIRPPGAREESEFLRRCVKCGACMKVCPTNALHPASWEAGIGGIWTPILVPKIGYCDDRCTLCGQVCPTEAIQQIGLDEKLGLHGAEPIKIGLAYVDRNRCLPWAQGKPCIVCEEVCPTVKGQKAIKLVPDRVRTPDGQLVDVRKPVIHQEYCIGCGICENKCPVKDSSAIIVTCVGETRSRYNRISISTFQ